MSMFGNWIQTQFMCLNPKNGRPGFTFVCLSLVLTFRIQIKTLFNQHSNATFREQVRDVFTQVENERWQFCNYLHKRLMGIL